MSIIYKTVVQVTELLGLEKSYATLSLLKQTKNVNILLQFIRYAYYISYIIFIFICVIYFFSYSYDNEDLNISDKFKYTYKICLFALQHAEINTDTIKIITNLSASILNICQDSMY